MVSFHDNRYHTSFQRGTFLNPLIQRMNPFERISNETWVLILSSGLQTQDIRSASLVCRHFRDVAQPMLFSNISLEVGEVCIDFNHRGFVWYPLSKLFAKDFWERLHFLTSSRMAPFVKSIRINYTRIVTSQNRAIHPENDPGLLDEAISCLHRFTSLKSLRFRWSPISIQLLRRLCHPSLSHTQITFLECIPTNSIDRPILGSHNSEITVYGSSYIDVDLAPLLRAFWTQSLTKLSIWKVPASVIYEEASKSWGKLNTLRILTVDDHSLTALLPYSELFPNVNTLHIRGEIGSVGTSIHIPYSSFPRLEVLECNLCYLPQFVGRSINRLKLFAKYPRLGQNKPIERIKTEIRQSRRLLHWLSELNVRALTLEGDVLEELVSSCPRLLSLTIDTYYPKGRLDKRSTETKLKEFLVRFHEINWPSTLRNLRIEPPDSWGDTAENHHTRERLFLAALNSLDMSHFPARLQKITFVTRFQRTMYCECQSFFYVTRKGNIGKWLTHETYKVY